MYLIVCSNVLNNKECRLVLKVSSTRIPHLNGNKPFIVQLLLRFDFVVVIFSIAFYKLVTVFYYCDIFLPFGIVSTLINSLFHCFYVIDFRRFICLFVPRSLCLF